MRTLVLSDIHVDTFFAYAVEPKYLKKDDPAAHVVPDTLEYIWEMYNIPETDALILGGDYSNDFLTFSRTVPWLSKKYKHVFMVLGNHDILVRGATPSKSNLQFTSSEQKIAEMKKVCHKFPNVHLLDGDDGDYVDNIAGCMGMCDFQCESPRYGLDAFTGWKRNWFDGVHWRYFKQEPQAIWAHYEQKMEDILKRKPKVIVTHFVPYELGVSFEFRNDPWNYVFYFNASKFLDMMEDDTYWVCGHVHGRRMAEYVNSSGKNIHILCNPVGYPGEGIKDYCDVLDYRGEKLERSSKATKQEDFIIDLPDIN